jgi:hypothetical protein
MVGSDIHIETRVPVLEEVLQKHIFALLGVGFLSISSKPSLPNWMETSQEWFWYKSFYQTLHLSPITVTENESAHSKIDYRTG